MRFLVTARLGTDSHRCRILYNDQLIHGTESAAREPAGVPGLADDGPDRELASRRRDARETWTCQNSAGFFEIELQAVDDAEVSGVDDVLCPQHVEVAGKVESRGDGDLAFTV